MLCVFYNTLMSLINVAIIKNSYKYVLVRPVEGKFCSRAVNSITEIVGLYMTIFSSKDCRVEVSV